MGWPSPSPPAPQGSERFGGSPGMSRIFPFLNEERFGNPQNHRVVIDTS